MRLQDRRIGTARWRREAIAEARTHRLPDRIVHIDRNAPARAQRQGPQVIDAMRVVGVVVRVDDGVDCAHLRGQQLLAQIGRRVDENCRRPVWTLPLHEAGAAPSPVLGVGRIARAPVLDRCAERRRTSRTRER